MTINWEFNIGDIVQPKVNKDIKVIIIYRIAIVMTMGTELSYHGRDSLGTIRDFKEFELEKLERIEDVQK